MKKVFPLTLKNKLFLGRILTRSGDQAWDFAVPIAILKLLPGELQYAAFYYFLIKLSNSILLPRITSIIDRINRFKAAKLGIVIQLSGVIVGFVSLIAISLLGPKVMDWYSAIGVLLLFAFILGGIMGSIGSNFMDIAIANDLVPSSLSKEDLPSFNSKLRQIDLFTEFGSPILAGLLLIFELENFMLFGFSLVALWNLASFFPEYWLLKEIFRNKPSLMEKFVTVDETKKSTFIKKLSDGWKSFFKEPIAIVAIAYACLWLSVLSPHGVLLTGFLKDGWRLPEWGIGLFRGFGGFFGLLATILFPKIANRYGVEKGSRAFLLFQLFAVTMALMCFSQNGLTFQIAFLVLILLSRVGLYGFSLGEMQLRQVNIKEEVRGEFNGFATALTGIATIGLYASGALLPTTSDFKFLVMVSVFMVFVSFGFFEYWIKRYFLPNQKVSDSKGIESS